MTDKSLSTSCSGCSPATTSGGSCGCDCGGSCGCDQCGVTVTERVNFFSGQLLVHEDLQQVMNYTVTKHRLHNRFLHGAGVVCGLLVRCHPCGGGKVVVEPGMALDCCGNDIVVPCPTEVDINALIRELRVEQLAGYDCGDPCDEDADPDDPNRHLRRYCLYVRYCEEPADPVTPYVTGDDCANVECEFSRIREGYRFELRCPDEDECPPTMWDKIRACIDDLELADRSADDANALRQFSGNVEFANQQIQQGEPLAYIAEDQQILVDGTSKLQLFLDGGDENDDARPAAIKEIELRETYDTLRDTSAAIVRYDLLDQEGRATAEENLPGIGERVEVARATVRKVGEPLKTNSTLLTSKRDRTLAIDGVEQALQWTAEQSQGEIVSVEKQYFAYQASASPAALNEMSRIASQLRDWLLRSIDKRGLFADCRLRDQVASVRIPSSETASPEQLANAAYTLVYAFLRYLIDCICAALNPPCTPCDDTSVKLACVEVEDCDVVRICNLERTYVLSWPTMRYWIPFLCEIGNAFERLCCEFVKDLKRPRYDKSSQRTANFERRSEYYVSTAPPSRVLDDQPEINSLLRFANISDRTARSTVNIGGNVGNILMNEPGFELPMALLEDSLGRPRDDKPAVQIEPGDEPSHGGLHGRVEELDEAVRKRLTATTLGSTSVIRKLREQLDAQREANEALSEKVEKLMETRNE